MSSATGGRLPVRRGQNVLAGLLDRQLVRYPDTGQRTVYLAITVLATVALFYEAGVATGVTTKIMQHYGFTFVQFVFVGVVSSAVGAVSSLAAGLADRWGRANLVVGGLLVAALLVEFALPNASSKAEYTAFFALLGVVEGVALVVTPALIRDFSPQVGRAAAMAFWAMGPALASVVVTEVASYTLDSHPDWQFQFQICGLVGLVVWAVALVGLRELSPQLRGQVMMSLRDRALIEARAAGIEPDKLLKGHWRQMLRLDILGPAFGGSVALLMWQSLVGFTVIYFVTVFGYSEARANHLGNWHWIAAVVALLAGGLLSDRFRVRKPFMLVGSIVNLVGIALFGAAATKAGTSYHSFVLYFVLISIGGALAYPAWMAAFTETVEKHNPAATATGLGVANGMVRFVLMISFAIMPLVVVPAASTLSDEGPRVQQITSSYQDQVGVLQRVDPGTVAALMRSRGDQAVQTRALSELSGISVPDVAKVAALGSRYRTELATAAALGSATQRALDRAPTDPTAINTAVREIAHKLAIPPTEAVLRLRALGKVPPDEMLFLRSNRARLLQAASQLQSLAKVPPGDLAYLQANGKKVAKAKQDNPGQWQVWWWVCFIGRVAFIPSIFLLTGRWSPRKARQDQIAHERMVEREMAQLRRTS